MSRSSNVRPTVNQGIKVSGYYRGGQIANDKYSHSSKIKTISVTPYIFHRTAINDKQKSLQ